MTNQWWQSAVVYQIYPKSFKATHNQPTGDLAGIISRLDYLKTLGVDVLWLTPVYASPGADNGYDISDYYVVDPAYGTLEDLRELLQQAHSRGIKIIMDIVVNHTSTAHRWFQEALVDRNSKYFDYYIWREGKSATQPPNNWVSKFGGSAWQYVAKHNLFYLHLFDVTQADLNWENPELRNEIYQMMRWWLDFGVDGFRLDVINLISKNQEFPDDTLLSATADGRKYYTDGPRIHEYLQEMNSEVFSHKEGIITVGEMSSTSIANCIRYTDPSQQELNMVFSFHHLKVDYRDGQKWSLMDYDFLALKKILSDWQLDMQAGNGWNALFWSNHDQPRALSRFGDDVNYPYRSATMLATALHLMRGTPYIYQGEEIGMTNPGFKNVNDYRDVESINAYRMMVNEWGLVADDALAVLRQKSRDNARTPMQWDDSINAGFSTVTPWIEVAGNYQEINAAKALEDRDSVFYYYQRLIQLRKEQPVIASGEIRFQQLEHPQLLVYTRHYPGVNLLVVCNFSQREVEFSAKELLSATCLISNFNPASNGDSITMVPFAAAVWQI